MVEQGVLRFVVGGVEKTVKAGEVLRIPPHVPHSAEALEDSIAVDVFSPVREELDPRRRRVSTQMIRWRSWYPRA